MAKTNIEWADEVLNPFAGCNEYSDGCTNCYAKNVMFPRLKGIGKGLYGKMEDFRDVKWDLDILRNKLKGRKKPKRFFIGSMGDLFHEDIPDKVIYELLQILGSEENEHHTFLILTKRFERLEHFTKKWKYFRTRNIQFGISICNVNDLVRAYNNFSIEIPIFISFEPLLEGLDPSDLFDLLYVNWVIVGAETGNKRRRFQESWALKILEEAKKRNIPFFFKQQFIDNKKVHTLNGEIHREIPKTNHCHLCGTNGIDTELVECVGCHKLVCSESEQCCEQLNFGDSPTCTKCTSKMTSYDCTKCKFEDTDDCPMHGYGYVYDCPEYEEKRK